MKFIYKFLLAVLFLVPSLAFSATTATWVSTTTGIIAPQTINGVKQGTYSELYIASSPTGTSVFNGNFDAYGQFINLGDSQFLHNGTTLELDDTNRSVSIFGDSFIVSGSDNPDGLLQITPATHQASIGDVHGYHDGTNIAVLDDEDDQTINLHANNGNILTGNALITTPNDTLTMCQTGDYDGVSCASLVNREGSNGLQISDPTLDLSDLSMLSSSGNYMNLRFEHRGGLVLAANGPGGTDSGEFQFGSNDGPAFFESGTGRTSFYAGGFEIDPTGTIFPQYIEDVAGHIILDPSGDISLPAAVLDQVGSFGAFGQVLTATGGSHVRWTASSTGIKSIGPLNQLQTGTAITLATSSTAFNGLTSSTTIIGSGNTLTFTNTLAGRLGIAGGGTGTTTAPTYGKLLVGNAGGTYDLLATSSLGIGGLIGTVGQVGYFNATNNLVGTSSIFISTAGGVGIDTASPYSLATMEIKSGSPLQDNLVLTNTGTSQKWALVTESSGNLTVIDRTGSLGRAVQLNQSGEMGIGGNPLSGVTLAIAAKANDALTMTATAGGQLMNFSNLADAGSNFSVTAPGSADPRTIVATGGNGITYSDNSGNELFRFSTTKMGKLGLGTTTPWGQLSIKGLGGTFATTTPLFVIATSTGMPVFYVDSKGNQYAGGNTVSVSSCGSGASVVAGSNNTRGRFVVGSTALQSTCTITYTDGGYTATNNAPVCSINVEGGLGISANASTTATTMIVTPLAGSTFTSDTITYNCGGF